MIDFVCPKTKEIVDKEYCDTFSMNRGCKYKKSCSSYKNESDEEIIE